MTGPTPFEEAVARVLDALTPGDVVTYGEVAAEAGYPGRARAVGRFLAEHGGDHPWWRVVTASGRLVPGHEVEHARRLRAEGVTVVDGRVPAQPAGGPPPHPGPAAVAVPDPGARPGTSARAAQR